MSIEDRLPYILPCRHCDEAVAVRMKSGRLSALGQFGHGGEPGAIYLVCPACGRHTRVRRTLLQPVDIAMVPRQSG